MWYNVLYGSWGKFQGNHNDTTDDADDCDDDDGDDYDDDDLFIHSEI